MMAKFKPGDRVRITKSKKDGANFSYDAMVGDTGTIDELTSICPYILLDQNLGRNVPLRPCGDENCMELITTNKKTIMSTIKSVSIKLRAALGDEKANQIVAGLRNDDLSLTTAGEKIIINAIADGEDAPKALITEATNIIAEAKKKD